MAVESIEFAMGASCGRGRIGRSSEQAELTDVVAGHSAVLELGQITGRSVPRRLIFVAGSLKWFLSAMSRRDAGRSVVALPRAGRR
jgi:hypothetical protein